MRRSTRPEPISAPSSKTSITEAGCIPRSATNPRLSSKPNSANSKPSERTQPKLCHSYPVSQPRGAVQLYDRVDGRVYPGSSPGTAMTKDGLKARHFLSDFPNSCYPAPFDQPPPSAAGNEVGMDHDTAPAPP